MAKRKRKAKVEYVWVIRGPDGKVEGVELDRWDAIYWHVWAQPRVTAFTNFYNVWRRLKRKGYRCERVAIFTADVYKAVAGVKKAAGTTADGWDVSISVGGRR